MTSALYVQTRKEARALLPWAAGVALATVVMAIFVGRYDRFPNFRHELEVWFVVIHAAGVLAVAALSLGHELTHGTLPALLVQPVARRRVLGTKLAVLAVVAVTLGLVATLTAPVRFTATAAAARPLLIWGPAVMAVGLVPLLTLLTRRPMAGAIFAVMIPGAIVSVAERFYPLRDGVQALTIGWYGTLIASACGLIALAYAFAGAEAAGDERAGRRSSPALRQPALANVAPATQSARKKQNWMWLTVKKELRLQQLTLAVTALFAVACGIMVVLQRMDPPYAGQGVGAIAALHGIFIAIIAGSRASAEERHMGVLATQALQPKPGWRPWTIKVAVTLAIAVGLAVALPALFRVVDADAVTKVTESGVVSLHPAQDWFELESEFFAAVALVGIAAIYVSSLSSNSLWALLSCFPVAGVLLLLFGGLERTLWSLRRALQVDHLSTIPSAMRTNFRDPGWRVWEQKFLLARNVQDYLFIALFLSFSLFVLYLAHRNHRTLERGRKRIAFQSGLMAASLVIATAAYFGAAHLVWAVIR